MLATLVRIAPRSSWLAPDFHRCAIKTRDMERAKGLACASVQVVGVAMHVVCVQHDFVCRCGSLFRSLDNIFFSAATLFFFLEIVDCPGSPDCSSHGDCVPAFSAPFVHTCNCTYGWKGDLCEIPVCPSDCSGSAPYIPEIFTHNNPIISNSKQQGEICFEF